MISIGRTSATGASRGQSRGQIAILFALSIVLFAALCAVVVDVAFYWVSTLQAQRAADAAALAGAVYLPGDTTKAYSEARASAAQNGYTTGVTITTIQDSQAVAGGDPRQLDVTINAAVPTFFARVVGISSFPVTKSSKGVYVLPVPMGSPLSYYGVGDFTVQKTVTNTTTTPFTDVSAPGYTSVTPAGWTNPDRGWATGTTNFATSTANNQVQDWRSLNIPSIGGASIDGIVVSFNAKVPTGTTCRVTADVSWNGGGTNYTNVALPTPNLSSTLTNYQIGDPASLAAWGNRHTTWTKPDFTNANFRVRLTYLKPGTCGTLSLNGLSVTVYSHTDTTTTTTTLDTTYGVKDGATLLASQGGWGAVITKGGDESNGDAYSPANNGGSGNSKYDPNGYNYVVSIPAAGSLKVFDPGFCAMGQHPTSGGALGVGDHWIGSQGTPVSTYYTLWNTNGKPGLPSAWSQVSTSGALFENQKGYDPANVNAGDGPPGGGAISGCDAYHDAWWTVAPSLGSGTYVLSVQTTKTKPPNTTADASINSGTNAENMWSIEAPGGFVYGNGRMAVYNNLQVNPPGGGQQFYLAKIDERTGAGKTAQIDIFDAGDVTGDATLKVYSPDNNVQTLARFNYTTDGNCVVGTSDACSGTNRTSIRTANGRKVQLQQHVDPHQHPPADDLRGRRPVAGRLVADPLRGPGWRQRHHDVAGIGVR